MLRAYRELVDLLKRLPPEQKGPRLQEARAAVRANSGEKDALKASDMLRDLVARVSFLRMATPKTARDRCCDCPLTMYTAAHNSTPIPYKIHRAMQKSAHAAQADAAWCGDLCAAQWGACGGYRQHRQQVRDWLCSCCVQSLPSRCMHHACGPTDTWGPGCRVADGTMSMDEAYTRHRQLLKRQHFGREPPNIRKFF